MLLFISEFATFRGHQPLPARPQRPPSGKENLREGEKVTSQNLRRKDELQDPDAASTCSASLKSVSTQVSAMLSIMSRYKWRQLGILTSEIAGHDDFVQAVRDQITAAKADDGR